ncbi:TPA: type IV pilus biogenesis protein PilP [Burkholderia cenocepacia]|uniref:Type IV pilus biogenesis protein PilP n=1 Tax=Burkholderia vietnamiensis TaxID=60552 RepID=A0ABS1AYR0_BURVI|nr:type IV pilus biogenesis protein PilP [Burkholderia vietnamiensis]MBJ9688843.1 type IV pilus biogenesis protein PilP [Burkholderia vietnamiensis]
MNLFLRSPRQSIRTALAAGGALAFATFAMPALGVGISVTMMPNAHAAGTSMPASGPRASASATGASSLPVAPTGASTPNLGTMPALTNVTPQAVVQPENAEVDALTRETRVLEARLKNETLKRDIRKVQRDSSSSTNASGMPPADALPSPIATGAPIAPLKLASDWVLIGTGAYDGRQSATISVNGTARDVRVGDTIDGWTVKSIVAQRVTLGRGRATKTVSM